MCVCALVFHSETETNVVDDDDDILMEDLIPSEGSGVFFFCYFFFFGCVMFANFFCVFQINLKWRTLQKRNGQ